MVVLWGTAGAEEEAAVRKHGLVWIMQATAAPGGPGTQGSRGHAGDDVEKLEESGRVWKWRGAGWWGAVPR